MNISNTLPSSTGSVELLLSNGNRKTLVPPKGTQVEDTKKTEAITNLSSYQCVECHDVHENPLQLRCCEAVLCAHCYLSLPNPKRCPLNRNVLTGRITDDLKSTGRLCNNHISEWLLPFKDIQPTGTDSEKSGQQNAALKQLQTSNNAHGMVGASTHTQASRNQHTIVPYNSARINNSSGGVITIGGGKVTVGGGHVTIGSGMITVGGGSIIINGKTLGGGNHFFFNGNPIHVQTTHSAPVKNYDYQVDDFSDLKVRTQMGSIVIKEQNPVNSNTVSIAASEEPRISNNALRIDCNGEVSLMLPVSFNKPVNLHTDMGNITTRGAYTVTTGGKIHSNMGNINIKVDSLLVDANATTNMGKIKMEVSKQHDHLEDRATLRITVNMGDITVSDR